jgi:O-antigen/teichoic acid export membrane protein
MSPTPEARFRNEMGRISRHSAVFFTGTLFTAAAGYLFKIYVARMLGAAALGVYALGMTIVGFFAPLCALGLPQSAVRFVAAYSATQQYQRLFAFLRHAVTLLAGANLFLAGVMIMVGPWVARNLYHAPELVPYLPLFAMILVFGAFGTFFGQMLAGYKDIALRTVISSFIGISLNIALGVILIAGGMGLRGYVLAQVIAGAAVFGLLVAASWRLTPIAARRFTANPPALGPEVFWFSVTAFGVSILEFLQAQIDKILLGVFLDVRQVGIYAVAASLVAFVPVALQSVNQIFSPTVADLHARAEHALLGRLFQTLTKWIFGLTVPLAFVMLVFARPLMRLFGPAFEAGWLVLILGTLGQLVNAGVGSVGYLLFMSGNQARLIRVQVLMTIFMTVATLGLIRPLGMVGAALAAALSNVLTNYLYLRQVRAALHISPYNRTYLRLLAPCFASLAVTAGIRLLIRLPHLQLYPEWVWVAIALLASYATFCGLALLSGLDNDDKMIVAAIRGRIFGTTGRTRSIPR